MKTLKQEVDTVEEKKSFTSPEIARWIPNSKWIYYSNFKKVKNLRTFMEGKKNLLILLDPPTQKVGHFVLLIFKSSNYVCFFDPYGNRISKLLSILNLDNSLLHLLRGYSVDENIKQFEVINNRVETCGRWCIIRGIHHKMSNIEFIKYFRFKNVALDELAVLMTELFLQLSI